MENNDITYFGKTNFRGQEHIFGIKRDDRRRHMYVIGKTGMGKTTLLENMIISDINAGNGLAVVDPHGDLAEEILNFIPASRVNDVVYFNPADIDYPIAFNVMEHVDPKYRHLVASGLIGVFKKIWADSWGPRLEYLLRNTILGLLEYPDSTLLGVPRMLIDEDYRRKVVSKISDPVVKTFWTDEFTKYSKQFMVEAISPIQNKVGQFLSSSLVRNIVSQPHSSIDMRDIMDNKKIFIINLAKGRIGEDYSALLGAMLITKIQLAAMGRVDTPEPERQDFYLYVDEFQNFATESFAGILSEARKYRLDLIVAHQYIGQLEETVRDAIFGNVGTLVTFRVGATDAEFLEKETEPIFMMNDLVNLAKYDMYLKLMIDGVSGDAFSATSLPPIEVTTKSDPEKIIKVSRERYTKKREVVEDKVARWSGYIQDEEGGELRKEFPTKEGQKVSQGEKREKVDTREMWDATCAMCGTAIKVPFQPDPSRATYCKDCLVQVRKQIVEPIKIPQIKMEEPKIVEAPISRIDVSKPQMIVENSEEKNVELSKKTIPENRPVEKKSSDIPNQKEPSRENKVAMTSVENYRLQRADLPAPDLNDKNVSYTVREKTETLERKQIDKITQVNMTPPRPKNSQDFVKIEKAVSSEIRKNETLPSQMDSSRIELMKSVAISKKTPVQRKEIKEGEIIKFDN